MPADNVALPAFAECQAAIDQYILLAGHTAANLQQWNGMQWINVTDRRTYRQMDTVTSHRLYRVVQKSGHPIYFCYNFSK